MRVVRTIAEEGSDNVPTVRSDLKSPVQLSDVHYSVMRALGTVPAAIRQMPALPKGEVLWERVPELGVERRSQILVQRERRR